MCEEDAQTEKNVLQVKKSARTHYAHTHTQYTLTLTHAYRRGVIYDWPIVRILRRRSGHDKIVNVYRQSYYTIILYYIVCTYTTTILLLY